MSSNVETIIDSSTTCKQCGSRILWMKTRRGKWIPVNFEPKFIRHAEYDPSLGHVVHLKRCRKEKR